MWGGYPQQTWPYMTPSIWVLNTAIPLEQFSFTLSLEYYIPTFHLWFRKKISSNPPGAKFYSLHYHPDPHYSPFPTKKCHSSGYPTNSAIPLVTFRTGHHHESDPKIKSSSSHITTLEAINLWPFLLAKKKATMWGPRWISKLVYNSNNYCWWYL